MASLAKRESGFTLFEILLVIVIVGVALALAVPNLFPSDEELTRRESEQVLALLQVARDEAAFGGRVISVRISESQLEFFERDAGNADRWNPSSVPALKAHALPGEVRAQLSIAGNVAAAKDAQITFLPVGVSLPFVLTLRSPAATTAIVGDAIGNLRFKPA